MGEGDEMGIFLSSLTRFLVATDPNRLIRAHDKACASG